MIEQHPQAASLTNNNKTSVHYKEWFNKVKDHVNEGEAPEGTQEISASTGVLIPSPVTNLTIRLEGSGGAVDISANPQIVHGFDGQRITLEGTSATNTVKLDDGDGLKLAGGASFTIGEYDVISFHFNVNKSLWIENSRSNN
jgi:hypothetical protein